MLSAQVFAKSPNIIQYHRPKAITKTMRALAPPRKKNRTKGHTQCSTLKPLSLSLYLSYLPTTTPIPPADLPHWSPPKNNAAKTNRAAHTIYLRSNDRAKFKIKLKTPLSLALFGMERGGTSSPHHTHTIHAQYEDCVYDLVRGAISVAPGWQYSGWPTEKKPPKDFRKAKVRRSGDWIAQRGLSYPSGTA